MEVWRGGISPKAHCQKIISSRFHTRDGHCLVTWCLWGSPFLRRCVSESQLAVRETWLLGLGLVSLRIHVNRTVFTHCGVGLRVAFFQLIYCPQISSKLRQTDFIQRFFFYSHPVFLVGADFSNAFPKTGRPGPRRFTLDRTCAPSVLWRHPIRNRTSPTSDSSSSSDWPVIIPDHRADSYQRPLDTLFVPAGLSCKLFWEYRVKLSGIWVALGPWNLNYWISTPSNPTNKMKNSVHCDPPSISICIEFDHGKQIVRKSVSPVHGPLLVFYYI